MLILFSRRDCRSLGHELGMWLSFDNHFIEELHLHDGKFLLMILQSDGINENNHSI